MPALVRMAGAMVALACTALSSLAISPSPPYDGQLRPTGDGRLEAYMYPISISSHASFLERSSNGDILLAWYSGAEEGNDCISTFARLAYRSMQWFTPIHVQPRPGYSNENPVLFNTNSSEGNETLYLFYPSQPSENRTTRGAEKAGGADNLGLPEFEAEVFVTSLENGSWTTPKVIFGAKGSFLRNRFVIGLDGRWILPMYYATDDKQDYSHIKTNSAEDVDVLWGNVDFPNPVYLVQPSVVRSPKNESTLISFFRDRKRRNIYRSTSTDDGNTWGDAEPLSLPNNNSGISAYVLLSGRIALVYNPTNGDRNPLTISLSEDDGVTWPYSRNLEFYQPGSRDGDNTDIEFSYPSILQSPDGTIHISYTYLRETIKYVQLKEDWIMAGSSMS